MAEQSQKNCFNQKQTASTPKNSVFPIDRKMPKPLIEYKSLLQLK